jgi:hypothetical protein
MFLLVINLCEYDTTHFHTLLALFFNKTKKKALFFNELGVDKENK